nr:hypothetical protein CFP56_73780 [Quercus suber]
MADLLEESNEHTHHEPHSHDGHISSDADDDHLPQIGLMRRRTNLEQAMSIGNHNNERPDAVRPGSLRRRMKAHDSAFSLPSLITKESSSADKDYFEQRRKKLTKLKKKELQAFYQWRDSMVAKFEAEMEAEHCREKYELATWKRDYFERAPRETAERLRSFQHAMSAVRAFGRQPTRRRNRPTMSYGGQILSTDSFEAGQYLAADNVPSLSRTKSLHRRGMSSDISGDQTSSDEASSGGYASTRQGSAWIWQRSNSRNSFAFDLPSSSVRRKTSIPQSPARSRGTPTRTTAPKHEFQLLVKRPTGPLGHGSHEPQDSSTSSPTVSSRSVSPLPSPVPVDHDYSKFTVMPPSWFGGLLGPTRDHSPRHSQTAQPRQNATQRHGHLRQISDLSSFLIKDLQEAEHHHVPICNVHLLSAHEKRSFLSSNADVEIDPHALMRRLQTLDRKVAEKFMVKPDVMETFNFRLIYNHREVSRHQHQSFIALSYRRRLQVAKHHNHYTLPLEPEIFQAVCHERTSEDEGIWVDQICINQESDEEKTISMSAMDMVYRSARVAVVVLDDIRLSAHESDVLAAHMDEYERMHHVAPTKRFRRKQPPWLETREDLYNVLVKLFRSSWWMRAWCRHEMRLAREHIFLVPCMASDDSGTSRVVRFTSHCLTHLLSLATEIGFSPEIELVKPALHAFFKERSHLDPEDRSLRAHHGNFTTVLAEVFAMETGGDPRIPVRQRKADALKDKISIILNTMECGIALAPRMRDPELLITKSDCHYMLLMLALAARDPGALCTLGPPMRLNQELEALSPTASSTWLCEPTNVDAGLNNYKTLDRMPSDAKITTHVEVGEHVVQLDLKFLNRDKASWPLKDAADSFALARYFYEVCEGDKAKHGRNRSRYLVKDSAANIHFGNMEDVYIETLACVFECGPDWMESVCHRYGVSRWKQCLQNAYELLIAFKNTQGKWPPSAWNNQAAGFIMDFVNFIIIRALPQRQVIHKEEWRPLWVSTDNGGRILTFVPRGNTHVAVPTALLNRDYIHLARLWVLQPRDSIFNISRAEQHITEWTLLGKSILFSDDLAIEQLHAGPETEMDQLFAPNSPTSGDHQSQPFALIKLQQKVFGREDIQREIRERSWLHF